MSAIASPFMALAALSQPQDQLLDRINNLRAQAGLPPLSGGEVDLAGPEADELFGGPIRTGPLLNEPSPQAQAVLDRVQQGQAATQAPAPRPVPAASRAPAPSGGAQRPAVPQQAPAPPAVAPRPVDPIVPLVRQITQFFSPGSDSPDPKRVPPVTTSFGGVTNKPLTDTGRLGDPFGGGFGRGPGVGINPARLDTDFGRADGTPRRFYTVRVGNLEVGRFPDQQTANVVRDRLRAALRQGPAPSIPRVGLGGGGPTRITTGAQGTDELLFGRAEESAAPAGRRAQRQPAAEEPAPGGLLRQPFRGNPRERRVANTLQALFTNAPTVGPTFLDRKGELTGAGREALKDARQSGLISEDTFLSALDPERGARRLDPFERLEIAQESGVRTRNQAALERQREGERLGLDRTRQLIDVGRAAEERAARTEKRLERQFQQQLQLRVAEAERRGLSALNAAKARATSLNQKTQLKELEQIALGQKEVLKTAGDLIENARELINKRNEVRVKKGLLDTTRTTTEIPEAAIEAGLRQALRLLNATTNATTIEELMQSADEELLRQAIQNQQTLSNTAERIVPGSVVGEETFLEQLQLLRDLTEQRSPLGFGR